MQAMLNKFLRPVKQKLRHRLVVTVHGGQTANVEFFVSEHEHSEKYTLSTLLFSVTDGQVAKLNCILFVNILECFRS